MFFNITGSQPTGPASTDDETDIGRAREFRQMKARLAELETLYATRFRHQVPISSGELRTKHTISTCGFHTHVLVSMDTPQVECATCDTVLDPFDVLREYVRNERNFAFELEHLRLEKDTLTKEIDQLKRERSNLRAQIKRAKK